MPRQGGNAASKAVTPTKVCSSSTEGLRVRRSTTHTLHGEESVGRSHTIVRLQTRIRRKDGTEKFGGFVFLFDLYNGILCCGFLYARLISVSFPATTPRATTPHRSLFRLPRQGLPRPTDTLRLPRRGLPRPYRYIQANRLPR